MEMVISRGGLSVGAHGGLQQQIEDISQLISSFNKVKEELFAQNESHLIRLVFQIASKLAYDNVNENQELITQLIKQCLEEAQADENVNVIVSNQQFDFVEGLKNSNKREFEFLKKVKFVSSDSVSIGGCIVETNFGVIDARIEERVEKLWSEFKQSLPKLKSKIG